MGEEQGTSEAKNIPWSNNWWTFEWRYRLFWFYDNDNNSIVKSSVTNTQGIKWFRFWDHMQHRVQTNEFIRPSNTIEMWRIYDKWWQPKSLTNDNTENIYRSINILTAIYSLTAAAFFASGTLMHPFFSSGHGFSQHEIGRCSFSSLWIIIIYYY